MTRTMRPPRPHPMDDEAPMGNRGALYVLALVVLIAFGGFVWNVYGGREPAHISAPAGAYKVAPTEDVVALPEEPASQDALTAPEEEPMPDAPDAVASAEAPAEAAPVQRGAPRLVAPRFVANGPFVAQLAALQSEEAVSQAWTRLSSRAPDLFRAANLDVERADLGQRGVYYRVRAGYFADRAQASLFCDRIRQMGQDCIVVSR